MARFVLQRLLFAVPLLLLISLLSYLMINAAPGDPIGALMDPNQMGLTPQALEARRAELGLDKPLPERYLIWLRETLSGNLGYSFATREPVRALLVRRFEATGQLVLGAVVLIFVFALPLGVISAIKKRTWVDYLANALGLFAVSVPSFFLALGMIYLFSLKLRWLPTAGMVTLGSPPSVWDHLVHGLMPVVALALLTGADLMRYTRAGLLDVLNRDYIRTARAKGVREGRVLVKHGLRTALTPLVTMLGLRVPQLLGGAVITETIFQWPGIGLLSVQSIQNRDYPVLMGVLLTSAVIVVLVNLLTDVAYGWIDPRVRLGQARD